MSPSVSWSVSVQGILALTVEQAWTVLTRDTELSRWFSDEAHAEEGENGTVTFHWTKAGSGVDRTIRGAWGRWDAPAHLALRLTGDDAGQSVTWTLAEYHGGTRLEVTHRGEGAIPDGALAIQRGWQHAIANLRRIYDDDGERIPALAYYQEQGWL